MFENLHKSKNVPGGLGFNFDIVIVYIILPNIEIEENSKLKIQGKFNNNDISITSSRINVTEFKPGRSLEFNENIAALKQQLLKYPLTLEVLYDGEVVGTCSFVWPDSFIECVTDCCGREVTNSDNADILKDNKKVGRMEINCRLQTKCYEFVEPKIIQSKIKLCNTDHDVLNPNDVMFVVGENKNSSIGCTDVEIIPGSASASSAQGTCLDLSALRHVHGKTLPNTDILNFFDTQCCKSKVCSNEYPQITKNIHDLGQSREASSHMKIKLKKQFCECEHEMKQADSTISDSRFASCSSTDSCQPCHCISDENASQGQGMVCHDDGLTEKPTKRYCPICHENITWLPKFAACPKCGFRLISYNVKEKPYDDTLTSNKILQEYSHITKPTSDMSIRNDQRKCDCRCVCKNDKICAHCRIKKLCEDIFQPTHKGQGDCGKCEPKSSDMYNICKTSSQDCRPYLTKVFQELRDLFDVNKTKKKKDVTSYELKKISKNESETEVQKSHQFKTNRKNFNVERKKLLMKSFIKQNAPKSQVFDYNKRRSYPGTKIGHKTCFAGQKIVPRNMGWLWNVETEGLRTGWMPGAIRKPIKVLMEHFLNGNALNRCYGGQNSEENINEENDYTKEPTLRICKRNGVYYITLRAAPIRQCTDPMVHMKPIQFKITKKPHLIEMSRLKQHLKNIGFAKCRCHKPICSCCCRSFLEKKKLEYQCSKESEKRGLPNCTDNLILSDTTDSEAEFDFGVTPPAGVEQPQTCKKKRKKVSSGTQYVEDDWKIKEVYIKPLGKFSKFHNCAIENRFGPAFGPYGHRGYVPGAVGIKGIYDPCGTQGAGFTGGPGFGGGAGVKRGKSIVTRGPEAFKGPDGKFSMAKYIAVKALTKPSRKEIAEKKKQQMALLKGANPPLLCMVDRRGKPMDPCAPCLPISCTAACLKDNRIC